MSAASTGTDWYDPQAVNDAVNTALGLDPTTAAFGGAVEPAPSDARSRRAMFLSGGGASGVYEAGVLQAMAINALHFDALVGTSIGSINAAAYAQLEAQEQVATPPTLPLTQRPLNISQSEWLRSILYFWEYVDQSAITDLDARPTRDLLNDLDRLYLSVSSIARFWTANLSPTLLHRPPDADANGNPLQRLRYQSRRALARAAKLLAWLETFLLLLPSLLGSLLALPFRLLRRALDPEHKTALGDLYTAAATSLVRPQSTAAGQGELADFGHLIVARAMQAYLPNAGPAAKRSLFGNERIQAVLKRFPSLRVYADNGNEAAAVVAQPSTAALPDISLAEFRRRTHAELRFTRTNMRNGNLEVSAVYPLQTALDETSARISKTLQGDDNHQAPPITAAQAASQQSLLTFITALEAVICYERLLGQPLVKTGRLLVGNPNLVLAVTASGSFPAAFPPVTIDQLYPIDPLRPDADNVALREICRLCDLYRATAPPQMEAQLAALRSEYQVGATLKPVVAALVINALPQRALLHEFVAACFTFDWPSGVTERQLRIAQLAACIVATWFDSYPIYRPQAVGDADAYLEQYNDGGAGDALPLGNAIDALEYVVGSDAQAADLRDATHYVYFVHLGDAPHGVRDVGDGSEIDPIAGTLPVRTMNNYLFYEYLLRYNDLGQRNRYLSDSRLSRKVHDYIVALREAGSAKSRDELLIEVVNIYPSVPLNGLAAFDVRLGYNHVTNRKQIAAGCSDTMRTLWAAVQANSPAVPQDSVTLLRRWLVPSVTKTAPLQPTLFCRNGACMYRRECPFADNAAPPNAVALVENYDIAAADDTSTPASGGVLTAD